MSGKTAFVPIGAVGDYFFGAHADGESLTEASTSTTRRLCALSPPPRMFVSQAPELRN
jgi:hypothetical protein